MKSKIFETYVLGTCFVCLFVSLVVLSSLTWNSITYFHPELGMNDFQYSLLMSNSNYKKSLDKKKEYTEKQIEEKRTAELKETKSMIKHQSFTSIINYLIYLTLMVIVFTIHWFWIYPKNFQQGGALS